MPHVYILRCSDGSYYVGSTVNLEYRLRQHDLGEGAEYTKRRRPVSLVYAHEFAMAAEAFAMEKKIQGWSRAKREALIAGRFDLLPDLSSRTPTKRSAPDAALGGFEARFARTSTTDAQASTSTTESANGD